MEGMMEDKTGTIKNKQHLIIEIDAANGDEIQFDLTSKDTFTVTVDEPWAGDTETGFGRTCSATFSREQAIEIRDWLMEALK